ncbi:MAG: hypothetical protein ABI191_00415 [Rhizomicrobium sp.]
MADLPLAHERENPLHLPGTDETASPGNREADRVGKMHSSSGVPASEGTAEIYLPRSKGLKYLDSWRKTRKLPQQANQAM